MVKKTKKAGVSGRYGSRYGKRIRENVRKIEEKSKKKHKCPQCGKLSVKRKGYALWECSKCGAKFAGGAYIPQTELGKIAVHAVQTGSKGEEVIKEIEAVEEASE